MTTTYKAVCERVGDWWAVQVPGVKGAHTQARRLDQVAGYAREVIALALDVPEESFGVEVVAKPPAKLREAIATAHSVRAAADSAQRDAAQAAARAARSAIEEFGLTIRDAGQLMGLSHQRVHQLLHEAPPVPRRRKVPT